MIFATWSFVEPVGSSPDESQNVIFAASTVRGDIVLPLYRAVPLPLWKARVPIWIININETQIYTDGAATNGLPLNVNQLIGNNKTEQNTYTDLAVLPPFYYMVTGIPSLFSTGMDSIILMRLLSTLIAASYVSFSLYELLKRKMNKVALAGFFLALTPETYFLSSTVNPNGTEIVASAALWVFTALLITSDKSERPQLYKKFAIVAGTLCLMRTLSPLWVLIAGVYILIGLGIKDSLDILKFKKNIKWSIFAFIGGTATFIWDVLKGQFPYPITYYLINHYQDKSLVERFLISVTRFPLYLNEAYYNIENLRIMIGAICFALAVVIIWLLALFVSGNRIKTVLMASLVLAIIVPAVVEAWQGGHLGLWWRGRYGLPIYCSVPILSTVFLSKSLDANLRERIAQVKKYVVMLTWTVLSIGLLGEVVAIFDTERIFMLGTNSSLFSFLTSSAKWETYPFGWQVVWLTLNVLAIGGVFALIALWSRKRLKPIES